MGFIASTLVLTNNGYKSIENVLMTDTILSQTGTFQPISAINKHEATPLWCIEILDRNPIRCTSTQLFYARIRIPTIHHRVRYCMYGEPRWIPACELTENHLIAMPMNRDNTPLTNGDVGNQIPEDIQSAPVETIQEFLNDLKVVQTPEIVLGMQRLQYKLDYAKNNSQSYTKHGYPPKIIVESEYIWFQVNNAKETSEVEPTFSLSNNSYCIENVFVS